LRKLFINVDYIWAIFWAIFSLTHPVTLSPRHPFLSWRTVRIILPFPSCSMHG
jgi:hypothetical protein